MTRDDKGTRPETIWELLGLMLMWALLAGLFLLFSHWNATNR